MKNVLFHFFFHCTSPKKLHQKACDYRRILLLSIQTHIVHSAHMHLLPVSDMFTVIIVYHSIIWSLFTRVSSFYSTTLWLCVLWCLMIAVEKCTSFFFLSLKCMTMRLKRWFRYIDWMIDVAIWWKELEFNPLKCLLVSTLQCEYCFSCAKYKTHMGLCGFRFSIVGISASDYLVFNDDFRNASNWLIAWWKTFFGLLRCSFNAHRGKKNDFGWRKKNTHSFPLLVKDLLMVWKRQLPLIPVYQKNVRLHFVYIMKL